MEENMSELRTHADEKLLLGLKEVTSQKDPET